MSKDRVAVLQFPDGTTADRVEQVPWRGPEGDDEVVFALSDPGADHELYLIFYRLEDGGKIVGPALCSTASPNDHVRSLFQKNSVAWSRKVRALARALSVEVVYESTNDETRWLVSELVPWRTFVPDLDMRVSRSRRRPGEPTIGWIERILPGFRMFSWYDPEADRIGWRPEDEIPEHPPAIGGRKDRPYGQWPYGALAATEYVLAAEEGSAFPSPFLRIGSFPPDVRTAGRSGAKGPVRWNVSTSALSGRDSDTVRRNRYDQLRLGQHRHPEEWTDLVRVLDVHFRVVLGLRQESIRTTWLAQNLSPAEWAEPSAEEIELYQLIGEPNPVTWSWPAFRQWADERRAAPDP